MFGSDILEIAIGMVFVYLLTSLVVTAANELLAGLLKSRGKTLWLGITQLLPTGSGNPKGTRDPNSAAATHDDVNLRDFANALYNHPLVVGLTHSSDKPSYIPSRTFTLALLDVISHHAKAGDLSAANIEKAISLLPDDLKKPLNLLWQEGGGKIEEFKTNVEVWFNNAMDRVSGLYKRKSQLVLFVISFFVAVGLNVDSMLLIQRLASDKALRSALVAQAEKYHPANTPAPTGAESAAQKQNFDAAIKQIEERGLPIGWHGPGEKSDPSKPGDASKPGELGKIKVTWEEYLSAEIPKHILGWILTMIAASLGAPFWFDVLNKFMNIRGAGKAPEEEPKAPKAEPHPAGPGNPTGAGPHPGSVM